MLYAPVHAPPAAALYTVHTALFELFRGTLACSEINFNTWLSLFYFKRCRMWFRCYQNKQALTLIKQILFLSSSIQIIYRWEWNIVQTFEAQLRFFFFNVAAFWMENWSCIALTKNQKPNRACNGQLVYPQCLECVEISNLSAYMLWLHHCRRDTWHVQVSSSNNKRHVMAFSVRDTLLCHICCLIVNKKSNKMFLFGVSVAI